MKVYAVYGETYDGDNVLLELFETEEDANKEIEYLEERNKDARYTLEELHVTSKINRE